MNYVANWYVRSWYIIEDSDTIDWITFDKYWKHIFVSESISRVDLSVIYSRSVDWLPLEENLKIRPPMKYSWFDPIPWGYSGATFFMYNWWKLVFNPNTTAIEWVLFSEDYTTWYWDKEWLPINPIVVSAVVNTVYKETWISWLTDEESEKLFSINAYTTWGSSL